ncbi:MAG: hypothetical protein EXS17_06465 [Phycisphaerales bacterium]|nr:hypothetical protein [Phycisphaerales bacterium]
MPAPAGMGRVDGIKTRTNRRYSQRMAHQNPHDDRLDIALEAILAGLSALRVVLQDPRARDPLIKADGSPVTAGDLAVQMAVCAVLAKRSPELAVVGEEGEGSVNGAGGDELLARAVAAVRASMGSDAPADPLALLMQPPKQPGEKWWTVDPIDGTKGFRSARHYALCLALVESGSATVGVLSCPTLVMGRDPLEIGADSQNGTIYAAVHGQGAWKFPPADGQRRVVDAMNILRRPARTATTLRVCDSIEGGSRAERMRGVMTATGLAWNSIALDSQCKYALVAEGAADCFMRVPGSRGAEKVWDHAPGVVVAQEAGAAVSDLCGNPLVFMGESLDRNVGTLACDREIAPIIHKVAAQQFGGRGALG